MSLLQQMYRPYLHDIIKAESSYRDFAERLKHVEYDELHGVFLAIEPRLDELAIHPLARRTSTSCSPESVFN